MGKSPSRRLGNTQKWLGQSQTLKWTRPLGSSGWEQAGNRKLVTATSRVVGITWGAGECWPHYLEYFSYSLPEFREVGAIIFP